MCPYVSELSKCNKNTSTLVLPQNMSTKINVYEIKMILLFIQKLMIWLIIFTVLTLNMYKSDKYTLMIEF